MGIKQRSWKSKSQGIPVCLSIRCSAIPDYRPSSPMARNIERRKRNQIATSIKTSYTLNALRLPSLDCI